MCSCQLKTQTIQSLLAMLLHSQWLDWSDLTLIIYVLYGHHKKSAEERDDFIARLMNANLTKALQLMVLH